MARNAMLASVTTLALTGCFSDVVGIESASTDTSGSNTTEALESTEGDASSGSDVRDEGSSGRTDTGPSTDPDGGDGPQSTDGREAGTDTTANAGSSSDDGRPTNVCGDGVLGDDEECDDAGPSSTCDIDCTRPACGDGLTNPAAGEECDTQSPTATCDTDCTVAVCGDGFINEAAGEFCDGARSCSADCQSCELVPSILFEADFSSADWGVQGEWNIGPATASPPTIPCGSGDPSQDTSPGNDNGIAGAVIGGNVDTAVHGFHYVTSPVIVAAAHNVLRLSFQRWLNTDGPQFMRNRVDVYDGAVWINIWENDGPISDSAWVPQAFDIGDYANAELRVRFGFAIEASGALDCSGWNLDDVLIETDVCL